MSKRWRTGVEAEITCKQYVLSVQRPPRPWANDQDKILKWVGQICYWGGFCKEKSSRIQYVTSHYHFMSNSQIQESIKLRRRKMFLWSSWFCSLIVTLAHTACASCGFRTDLTTDQPVCHRGTRQITMGHKKNRHGTLRQGSRGGNGFKPTLIRLQWS